MKLTILVIGYNRHRTLLRLFNSLLMADYNNDEVDLIISLDKGDNPEVLKVAEQLNWIFGKKIIITHKKRLGLKQHVLSCGNLTKTHGNLIVLEDDLFVSKDFYKYSKEVLKIINKDKRVAGASLYSFPYNLQTLEDFTALNNGYDNYYMQYACSWGQIWTPDKWNDFIEWYENSSELNWFDKNTPSYLANWPETSWLKYHIKYCIDTNKFFSYPYQSRTTNFSSVGENSKFQDTTFQTKLSVNSFQEYNLIGLDAGIKYDSYFESLDLKTTFENRNVTIDLYNTKKINKESNRYLLTTRILNYKIIDYFELSLRPIELNVMYGLRNEAHIFLYDLKLPEKNNYSNKDAKILYNNHLQRLNTILEHFLLRIRIRIKMLLKKK